MTILHSMKNFRRMSQIHTEVVLRRIALMLRLLSLRQKRILELVSGLLVAIINFILQLDS